MSVANANDDEEEEEENKRDAHPLSAHSHFRCASSFIFKIEYSVTHIRACVEIQKPYAKKGTIHTKEMIRSNARYDRENEKLIQKKKKKLEPTKRLTATDETIPKNNYIFTPECFFNNSSNNIIFFLLA